MMLSMVVVLPAPLRPTRQTTSCSPTLNETPCRMCAGPRKAWMFFTSSMSNVRPEQILGHVAVLADLPGRAVGEKPAFMHHDDAIGAFEHHVHVVFDDDRRDPAAPHHCRHRVHD